MPNVAQLDLRYTNNKFPKVYSVLISHQFVLEHIMYVCYHIPTSAVTHCHKIKKKLLSTVCGSGIGSCCGSNNFFGSGFGNSSGSGSGNSSGSGSDNSSAQIFFLKIQLCIKDEKQLTLCPFYVKFSLVFIDIIILDLS